MIKFSRFKLCISLLLLVSLITGTSLFISKWTSAHAASSPASEASWPMLGYNPQHTNFNSQEHVLNPSNVAELQLAWSYPVGASRFLSLVPSPAVANGIVFPTSDDGKLYALNAKTGQRKWSYYIGNSISPSPAIDNGTVFITTPEYASGQSYGGTIIAVDAQTGQPKWRLSEEDNFYTSPTVFNNIVYVGVNHIHNVSGTVYALDAQTGSIKWSYVTEGGIYDTPTVANGLVYVGGEVDSNVYALNALTGKVQWIYSTGGSITFPTVETHGLIYVNSDGDNLYALNALTGKVKWKNPTTSSSALAVANNVIYVTSSNGLSAIDAQIGTSKWSTLYQGDFIIANGVLYISGLGGISALNAQTGNLLWYYSVYKKDYQITCNAPIVVNGMVYTSDNNNTFYAFRLPQATN